MQLSVHGDRMKAVAQLESFAATVKRIWQSPGCRWFLLISLVWSLALHAWGLNPWGREIDYTRAGTLGQWVSGIGSLSAVLVAIGALFEERRRLARAAQQAHDASLSQLYAWLALVYEGGIPHRWEVRFNNATLTPIYYWVLRLEGYPGIHFCHLTTGPIVPGSTARVIPESVSVPLDAAKISRTMLVFCDVESRTWQRNFDGRCALVDQDQESTPKAHDCK